MILSDKPYTIDRLFRLAVSAAIITGIVWLLNYLSDVLIPFAVAMLLAYLLNPIVVRIQKKVGSRQLSIFLTLFAVTLCVSLICMFTMPAVLNEIHDMGVLLNRVVTDSNLSHKAREFFSDDFFTSLKEYLKKENLQQLLLQKKQWNLIPILGKKLLPGIWTILLDTTGFIWGFIGIAVIGLYLIFILSDYQKLKNEQET